MNRKEIIKAIENHTGIKPKYLGAPSFAYQIKLAEEIFTIDTAGKIKNTQGVEIELEKLLSGAVLTQTHDSAEEAVGFEVGIPIEGHTGVTVRNLINMIYSKQSLIKKAFEVEEDIVDSGFVESINKADLQSLEDFKTAVYEYGASGCLGIEFDFIGSTITFKFAKNLQQPEKLEAYTQFVSLLNKSAKEQKYALPKPTNTDNEKFTMRTWLIRLGFVGSEYKKSREILLKNLEGNGAFRKPKTTQEGIEKQ